MFAHQPGMNKAVLQPCLAASALSGSVELFDFWMDKGAKPGGVDGALKNAISSGNAAMVRRILEYPVDVHERVNGIPLLSYAVSVIGGASEGPQIVDLLLKAGASVHEKDSQGRTALFSIELQQSNVQQLVSMLMASGAAIDARDNSGDTALMYHAFLPKVVGALLAAGADPTPANNRGQTAVMLARQFSCESCAITLEQAAAKRRGVNGKAGQSR
jgi:hypothetical protein